MSSFYPAIASRTSTQLSTSRLLFQIHHDQSAIQKLQTQLSTGRRIENLSEDPGAAIRALAAQRQLEYKAQVDKNLKGADVILSASESTLAQAQNIMHDMRAIAVQAAQNTLAPSEVEALTAQVQAAIGKLAELGNSRFQDQYIFAGNDVLESPFRLVGDSVQFRGNGLELQTITDYAATLATNVTADDAFGTTSDKVVGTADINPSITLDTPLSALNRGEGIRRGAIAFGDGSESIQVDLSDAYTLSDVVQLIEAKQLSSRPLQVTLAVGGLQIGYQDGLPGLLRINEVGSGRMATDLSINNNGTSALSPVVGGDLDPILTPTTRIGQLFGGTSFNLGESFQIKQGAKVFKISTNGIQTVEDLFNRIRQSGAQVTAAISPNGRSLTLQSTESGTAMSIGEEGSNLATKLGLRTFSAQTLVQDLNFGQGIFENDLGADLKIRRTDGTEMLIDLNGVQTVGDVLNRINNNVNNFTQSTRIVASLATTGNGIVLTAAAGPQSVQIENVGGSQAAWGLGLVPRDQTQTTGTTSGTSNVIRGSDVSGVEVEGAFTSLIRLRQALETGQTESMERISQALEADVQRMSLARGFIGTRQQSVDRLTDLSAEQQVQLKQIESNEIDADLAQVISELSAREAALQASLQLMGQTARQSLFDYL